MCNAGSMVGNALGGGMRAGGVTAGANSSSGIGISLGGSSDADKRKRFEQMLEREAEQEEEAAAVRVQEEEATQELESWRSLFTVEASGTVEEDTAATESDDLLQQFIQHVVKSKIVLLDDLSAQFNLTGRQVVERLQALQEEGRITGVMDDRGKFISICEEEMIAVASFINEVGRVSVTQLAVACNGILQLDRKEEDDEL